MVAFFTSLIIIGISLIVFSIVMVMFDRKRNVEEKNEYISIKNELRELLEDSNQMVDELNRFSDYVVNKVDEKCSDFMSLMKEAPESKATHELEETKQEARAEDESDTITVSDFDDQNFSKDGIPFSEDIESISSTKDISNNENNGINPKYSEVIRLFEAGMSDSEIAKALNMGKGEVQLIVGINLHKIKV